MTDLVSKQRRSEIMQSIHSKNTKIEIALRRALHSRGYRYSLHSTKLPGRPDIVLTKYRVAIQVRGCFWHGHDCPDGRIPKSNVAFWTEKLGSNKLRDQKNDNLITRQGWTLIVVWECECDSNSKLTIAIDRIDNILRSRIQNPSTS